MGRREAVHRMTLNVLLERQDYQAKGYSRDYEIEFRGKRGGLRRGKGRVERWHHDSLARWFQGLDIRKALKL